MKFSYYLILLGTTFITTCCTKEIPSVKSEEDIKNLASKVSVRISWQESGSGFIVGKKRIENGYEYHVLTSRHVVSIEPPNSIDVTSLTKEEIKSLEKSPGKVDPEKYVVTVTGENQVLENYEIKEYKKQVIKDEKLDLAIVTFYSSKSYPISELSSDITNESSSYIYGFKACKNNASSESIIEFNAGKILSSISSDSEGYTIEYSNLSIIGMSGSPVFNSAGKVIAIHGKRSKNNLKKGREGASSILRECLRIPTDFTPNFGISVKTIMDSELAKKASSKFGE